MSIRVFLMIVLLAAPQLLMAETVPTIASAQSDYQAGHYAQAAEKYQKIIDSIKSQKNGQKSNLIICQYNLARCLDKAGQFDKAEEAYMIVAGSTDDNMALRAKYDLGCLYAQMANQESGADPKTVDENVRKSIRLHIKLAVQQWRAVLDVQPDHSDAAQKLERILIVSNEWEKAWKEVDLKKNAENKMAIQYLVEIENEILKAKSTIARLGIKDDSLVARQEFFQAAQGFSDTIARINILQEKLFNELSQSVAPAEEDEEQPQPGQPQAGQPDPQDPAADSEQQSQLEQVKSIIEQLIKAAQAAIEKSVQEMNNHNPAAAADAQLEAFQSLDAIYKILSSLPEMIIRSIKVQKELIKYTENRIKANQSDPEKETDNQEADNKPDEAEPETADPAESEDPAEPAEPADPAETEEPTASTEPAAEDSAENPSSSQPEDKLAQIELEENVLKQRILFPWAQLIVPKAEALLQELPQTEPEDNGQASPQNEPEDNGQTPPQNEPEDNGQTPPQNEPEDNGQASPQTEPEDNDGNSPTEDSNNGADSLQEELDALQIPEEEDVPPSSDPQQDPQTQKIQNMCKKALELGPMIPPLMNSAAEDLESSRLEEALESQKEALRLLEEIIKDIVPPEQDQQDQDQNQDQNQDQQDQDKQDQDSQNQDQDQDQADQDEENEGDQEDNPEETPNGSEDQEQEAQAADEQNDDELTDAQAHGLMRRVQARQEERKRLEAQLRNLLNPPDKVEKDW